MAPEQADGRARHAGPAADVYALGAIFYELLTGRTPFRAPTVLETLDLVRNAEPVRPSQLQPGMARDAETICLRCLDKEPARRYASAEALADDLGRFLRGETILARPTGPIERADRWTRRNRTVAALLAAVGVLLVSGLAGMTLLWGNARREAAAGDPQERGGKPPLGRPGPRPGSGHGPIRCRGARTALDGRVPADRRGQTPTSAILPGPTSRPGRVRSRDPSGQPLVRRE